MRLKLDADSKRASLIGIKVKKETKEKIQFISDREARPMSTQINIILENFIENYFQKQNIKWEEYAPKGEGENNI